MEIGHQDTTASNFEFLWQVINECLRFNPPAPQTDEYKICKDCTLGGVQFKKDTQVDYSLFSVLHNPNEWYHPEKFLPERFDQSHEYFKTPSGNERHPMSFQPFGIGERKCLGYQLAKTVVPNLVIKLNHFFDFELVDQQYEEEHKFPMAEAVMSNEPPVMVRCKPTDKASQLDGM